MSHHKIEYHQVKIIKDLEKQHKTYGAVQQTDVEPQEPKPSTLTRIKKV